MAQSPQVILDAQDSRLVYSGLWSSSGSEVNFSGTLFSSKATGATMTFPFNGTSVAVVGTYDIGGSCNTTFSIDGTQTQVTNPTLKAPENHKTIWSSETLPDGEHTLVYSIQSCTSDPSSSSGLSLWFDYVLYTPSPSSPGRVRYFTDDSDSRIRYSGSWKTSNENEDFGHSKHGGVKGDSLTYEFYGNQISVHGRIPNSPGGASQATFVVDGGKTGTFSSPNQKFVTYNKEFYNSGALPLGNHTLVVNPQTELEFWVDYFLVHDEVAIPTPSATPTPKSGGKIQITVITAVGIGVGCVVIGIAIAVFLFCLKRRRSQRRPYQHPPRSNPSKVDSSTLLPWTNSPHQYPPSPGHSTMAFSTKSSTPLVAASSPGYSTYAPSAIPSETHSRNHYRTNTAPSTLYAESSISSETRYRQRMPVVVAEEDVTYTLGGIQRHDTFASRDFPQSVDGFSEASYESEQPTPDRASRRRSRSHGSNAPRHGRSRSRTYNAAPSVASTAPSMGSRLRNATVSNPDEDPDSVAVLKRRQQEIVNGYDHSPGASGSGSNAWSHPPSSYVPPLPGSSSSRPPPSSSYPYEDEDPDSVAALKRRQAEQIVLSTQGYSSHQPSESSSSIGPRMHTDSGVRLDRWGRDQPDPDDMDDLPPMYTPR